MKVFLVGEFSFGALGASYSNAFEKLGHEVFNFDLIKEFNKVSPFSTNRYFNRLFGRLFYPVINKILLDKVKQNKPDLVFIIKGNYIFPETLHYIKDKFNTKLYCFNPDNPFNLNSAASNDFIRKSIPFYDCYFIWGRSLIPELKNAGAQRVEYLPFAHDPELHYPVGVLGKEKKIFGSDIAFIGSYDKEREEFLMNLTNYDLAIWGCGWEKSLKLKRHWKKRHIMGEDFSKVCNASKIILNHIRTQNGNAHNMKTFEIPACGGFVVTKRTEEQCEFFKENEDILCFSNVDELKSIINHYLAENKLRVEIAQSAYNKVRQHTYLERAKRVMDIFSLMDKA